MEEVTGKCVEKEHRASGASAIRKELEAYANPVKREYLPRFFKTGKGEYGEWKNRSRLGQCAGGRWDTFDAAKLMIFS